MDKYVETNRWTRKDYYSLQHVEHEPLDDYGRIPEVKSIVSQILF